MPFSGKILETVFLKNINKVWQKTIENMKKNGAQNVNVILNHPVHS